MHRGASAGTDAARNISPESQAASRVGAAKLGTLIFLRQVNHDTAGNGDVLSEVALEGTTDVVSQSLNGILAKAEAIPKLATA